MQAVSRCVAAAAQQCAALQIDSLRLITRPSLYALRSLSPNEFVYNSRTAFTTSFPLSKLTKIVVKPTLGTRVRLV